MIDISLAISVQSLIVVSYLQLILLSIALLFTSLIKIMWTDEQFYYKG